MISISRSYSMTSKGRVLIGMLLMLDYQFIYNVFIYLFLYINCKYLGHIVNYCAVLLCDLTF